MIFNKLFSEINYTDIEELISQKISENQNLEFKKEVWGKGDEEVREMLRDIASMANSYGGYLLIGLEESEDGLPKEISGIDDTEKERDRIFSSCLANIQPRISGLNIKCLSGEKGDIIVIHIPSSLRSPHMVNFKGLNQFWIRHDRQKSPMSVDEIRDKFIKNTNITISQKNFLENRKKELIESSDKKPLFILGVLPMGIEEEFVDVADEDLRDKLKNPEYSRYGGWDLKFSYDNAHPSFYGLTVGGKTEDHKKMNLFRNGYLEVELEMDNLMMREAGEVEGVETPVIYGYPVVEYTYSFVDQIETIFNFIGVETQFSIFCIFVNINGFGLRKYRPSVISGDRYLEIWKKDVLEIGPLGFDFMEKNKIAKVITDRIWQAFNHDNSDNFYKEGKFDTSLWK